MLDRMAATSGDSQEFCRQAQGRGLTSQWSGPLARLARFFRAAQA
jgi:hypothetical protein